MNEIFKKYKIGFTVDGSFLPIRNGAYYSIFNLMNSLYDSKKVEANLIVSYRGWDNPKLYYSQKFRTVFLHPKDYYKDTGILNYAFNYFDIDAVHVYNSEEVLNLGKRLKNNNVKIIYEAINIDHVLYGNLIKNKAVVKKLKTNQIKAMNLSDHILCRSKNDRDHIVDMGIDKNKITIYRGAIDVDLFKYKPRIKKRYKIVFLGHMYYPPNKNALALIKKIIPQLKKYNKKYTVTVIGLTPNSLIKKYKNSGIIFKSGIDNISNELLQYDIAIAPIYHGSGTRLKILDYLASGLPTISTGLGVEGLHNSISKVLTIENDIANYANKINEIENNLDKYKIISRRGREYVLQYYNWKNNIYYFIKLYKKII